MTKKEYTIDKYLNREIRKFISDGTIVNSFTRPPLKIIEDNLDNAWEIIVECPRCGGHAKYGELRMSSGYQGCDECYEEMAEIIYNTKKYNHQQYLDWENEKDIVMSIETKGLMYEAQEKEEEN